MTINPLLARFADVPALIEPSMVRRFEADLTAVSGHARTDELMSSRAMLAADDGFWFAPDDWRAAYRPYVVRDGVLRIPVKGCLLSDFPYAFGSWATGYLYIARAYDRGIEDGNVRGIALLVDCYGGQAQECFATADKIFAGRGKKPVRAYAEVAASAGYAIACSADSVTGSQTSRIGSIGVVMTHVDASRANEMAGLKPTLIFSGSHKVDGTSLQPLAEDVKVRWQSWCDEQRAEFCQLVARNRGISADAVSATEAQTYRAAEALSVKLIDGIAPLDDAVTAFLEPQPSASDDNEGEPEMTTPTSSVPASPAAAAAAPVAPAAAAAVAAPVAVAAAPAVPAADASAATAATTAERARISAIMSSDEAKGKTELANHLAFSTDMSADAAKGILAKAPAATAAAAAANGFAAAMAQAGNPQVGAEASSSGDQTDEQKAATMASAIVGAYRGNAAKPAA